MRIKEVVYSRLFNIGDYSNERIGFKAVIEEGDNPEQVLAELAERVLAFEESLAYYRELLRKKMDSAGLVEAHERKLENLYKKLAKLEIERVKLDEEEDQKAKCRIISIEDEIKQTLEKIEYVKESLRNSAQKHNEALRLLKALREQLIRGEIARPPFETKEIDAEAIIKQVEERVAKLKEENNLDVDDWDLGDLL